MEVEGYRPSLCQYFGRGVLKATQSSSVLGSFARMRGNLEEMLDLPIKDRIESSSSLSTCKSTLIKACFRYHYSYTLSSSINQVFWWRNLAALGVVSKLPAAFPSPKLNRSFRVYHISCYWMNIQVDPTSSNRASAMLNSKIRPRAVVGYGVKIFHPSPPNYVTRSPGFHKKKQFCRFHEITFPEVMKRTKYATIPLFHELVSTYCNNCPVDLYVKFQWF